jgi:acetyl esterase
MSIGMRDWGSNDRVSHLVSEGMPHGYYFFPGLFREGDEAFAVIARFLRAGFR